MFLVTLGSRALMNTQIETVVIEAAPRLAIAPANFV
jgi:hypothetical protein